MFGNLSKVVFRTPCFFYNNNIRDNKISNIKSFNNIPEESTFSTLFSFDSKNIKSLYFREKDFWKKNYGQDMNFNNNKRFSFYVNTSPTKKNDKMKNLKNMRYNTVNKKNENTSYLLTDSPLQSNGNNTKNSFSINKKDNNHNNIRWSNNFMLKKNPNKLIKDSYKKNSRNIFDDIKINYSTNEKEKNEKKFPKVNNVFKSQETIFQDNADNKLKSLITLKPEIKEQLQTKNRSMIGKMDFWRFIHNYKTKSNNPFYESMKIREEMNNYLK